MKKKTAAVVVTYNRKELLTNCLNAIFNQSHSVNSIYIIDNNSNDGTPEFLLKNKILGKLPQLDSTINEKESEVKILENGNEITINYIRKSNNDGGAGGFYEGMKQAYDDEFDWLWFMDDDGVPDKNQLKLLLKANSVSNIEYLNALVIDIEKENSLAFGLGNYNYVNELKSELIKGMANPFNGTLISRKIIQSIGLIKREMFIWGDESEYLQRVLKNGFEIATVVAAKHRHPKNKGRIERVIPFFSRPSVLIKPKKFAHIYYRNFAYLSSTYGEKQKLNRIVLYYAIYYLCRFQFKMLYDLIKYTKKGIKGDFK